MSALLTLHLQCGGQVGISSSTPRKNGSCKCYQAFSIIPLACPIRKLPARAFSGILSLQQLKAFDTLKVSSKHVKMHPVTVTLVTETVYHSLPLQNKLTRRSLSCLQGHLNFQEETQSRIEGSCHQMGFPLPWQSGVARWYFTKKRPAGGAQQCEGERTVVRHPSVCPVHVP